MTIKEISAGLLKIDAEDITADDMPTDIMRDVFEICGRDTALNLMVYMQGNIIQVPSRPWSRIQEKYVTANYDYSARSIKQIARTLCVTEKFVRDVLKTRVKTVPVEGQLSLLEQADKSAYNPPHSFALNSHGSLSANDLSLKGEVWLG